MNTKLQDRKQFIAKVLGALAGVSLVPGLFTGCKDECPVEINPAKIFGYKKRAIAIGEKFLAEHPGEDKKCSLVAATIADDAIDRKVLAKQISDDFARGEVIFVKKWQLSITEARLYGLIYLLD